MSDFHRKFYSVLILSVVIFNSATISAVASVGYLHKNLGETLRVTTCVPVNGVKPPLIFQIQGVNTNNKKVEIARVTEWPKASGGSCVEDFEYLVDIYWKINRTGAYSLSISAPNSKLDLYASPDGIDIPDAVAKAKKSNGNTGTNPSTVNSKSYQAGQDAVFNTSDATLRRQGFFGIFGATGQPVKSKATNWCVGMQKMFPPYMEDKDKTKGCIDAAMALYVQ
jgi:hypothetical protein